MGAASNKTGGRIGTGVVLVVGGLIVLGFLSGKNRQGPGIGSATAAQSKYDPEEAGYFDEFSAAYADASGYARDIVQLIQDANNQQENQQDHQAAVEKKNRSFQLLKGMIASTLPRLEKTLPPTSMKNVHWQFVTLLRRTQSANAATDVQMQCQAFYQSTLDFEREVANRPARTDSPTRLDIAYTPPGFPVSFPLTPGSSFAVNVPLGSLGSLSLSNTQRGVSKLILIDEKGVHRYFKMDRDFEVNIFVPGYIRIAADMRKKTLTIHATGQH